MVRISHDYKLSKDDAIEVIKALNGDEALRSRWLENMSSWLGLQSKQLEMYHLVQNWLKNYIIENKLYVYEDERAIDGRSEEELIEDLLHHYMEYAKCYAWDEKEQKVYINKFTSKPYFLTEEKIYDLLNHLNEKLQ